MAMPSTESSPAMFSSCDRFAANSTSVLLLAGRILLGWMFLYLGFGKLAGIAGFTGYLTSLKVPAPELMAWIATIAELALGAALILGVATRYAALLTFVYVLVATAIAHRYWEYPAPRQSGEFIYFMKNLSIMGGALLLFVTGAGRLSIDGFLKK